MREGVRGAFDLHHVFRLRHSRQHLLVHEIEVAVKINEEAFIVKGLSVVGVIGFALHLPHGSVGLQVLELLPFPEVQDEVHFVGGHFHPGRVGEHDLRTVEALVCLVDDGLIEHARLGVFLFDVDVDVRYATVEHALRNLHRGRLLFHAEEERVELDLCCRRGEVLEIEGDAEHRQCDEGGTEHDAQQRDARRFHGEQFKAFAEISEGDERSQQNGERKRLGHERDAHVPEELCQNVH